MRAAMTFVKFMDVALGALPEKFLFQPAGRPAGKMGVRPCLIEGFFWDALKDLLLFD